MKDRTVFVDGLDFRQERILIEHMLLISIYIGYAKPFLIYLSRKQRYIIINRLLRLRERDKRTDLSYECESAK